MPDHIAAFEHDTSEKVSNFSDASEKKQILLKKFLRHTDEGLKFLLHVYPVPVFIMGSEKVLGYFRALTKNEKSIVGYVHGNYENNTENQLGEALKPYLENWEKVKMEDLHHRIEQAADEGKLASGIREVWKQASQHKGRLLIIEKDYVCCTGKGNSEETINIPQYDKFSYIKDPIDDVIEKVLESGGDVEFADNGALADYRHICLIQYY